MSTLTSTYMESPAHKVEDCSCFTIDDVTTPFYMKNIATVGQEYTLSFWAFSDADGRIVIANTALQTATEWAKYSVTFTATSPDVSLRFPVLGTYYIYHPQLEVGNQATAWRPNPDDVDSAILDVNESAQHANDAANSSLERLVEAEAQLKVLGDSIASLVRDGNGGSLIKQDADGLHYFDLDAIEKSISAAVDNLDELDGLVRDEITGEIDILKSDFKTLEKLTSYISIVPDEDEGGPYIELGDPESPFKVVITNEQISFNEGSVTPAYINNQALMIEKAEVKNELQFGDSDAENTTGVWVWKQRSNGNLGLAWKEGV